LSNEPRNQSEPDIRQMLARAGTAAIANALLRRGLRNVCLAGLSPLSAEQAPMVGPAFTLRFIPAREDIDSMAAYARSDNLHRRAIEECPAGSVLVIDARGETRVSSAGDMMAARLVARGAIGLVTDGGFRDVQGIRQTGLPAYQRVAATAATPIALHPVELNVPVGCAGVAIYPGDLMVGDASGVVAVPSHMAEEVAREAYKAAQYEEFAELQIARGRSLFGLFPATPESESEYRAWLAAGRPKP
jgi:regulator of RNase E activity RraA